MDTPSKTPKKDGTRSRAKKPAADLQPPATGANRGSPAANVMKQTAKTRAESSGRS